MTVLSLKKPTFKSQALSCLILLFFVSPAFAGDPPIDYQQTTQIQQMNQKLEEMDEKLNAIYVCLKGNGKAGLETRTALIESGHKINTGWMLAISLAILGMAFFIIRQRVGGGRDG